MRFFVLFLDTILYEKIEFKVIVATTKMKRNAFIIRTTQTPCLP